MEYVYLLIWYDVWYDVVIGFCCFIIWVFVVFILFILFMLGRLESLFINYRFGEGILEFVKFCKEYEFGEWISLVNGLGFIVEICIFVEYVIINNC